MTNAQPAPSEQPNPEMGGFLGAQVGNLQSANDNSSPLLDGRQESGSGISVADSETNFKNRVDEIVTQGRDSTINTALNGSFWNRVFTPPEFQGYRNLYLLNPFFLASAGLTPTQVIADQMRDGFASIDDPHHLFGDSQLVSIKMARALSQNNQIKSTLDGISRSGAHTANISLTSLSIIEQVEKEAFDSVNATNVERAAEFYEKSGLDINTGERRSDKGAVWYKRAAWKLLGQRWLYQKRVQKGKALYREGHEAIVSNIRSLRRKKEEEVFQIQQQIDAFVLPRDPEGSADTVKLNAGRSLIHSIIHDPEAFIQNPRGFEVNGVRPTDIFGSQFNALDVVEALRAPQYEILTNDRDNTNYLESAITTNHWQFSHYNTLRTMKGLDERIENVGSLEASDLNRFQLHIDRHFERSNNNIDTSNPRALVNEIILALGSATPGLVRDLNAVIGTGNVYIGPTEIFWSLIRFFSAEQNLAVFDRLPPALKQKIAQFLFQKRDEMEETLVSGGIEEPGTLAWRAAALNQGKIVLEEVENVRDLLPELAGKITSLDRGVANQAFQDLKSFIDAFALFQNIISDGDNQASVLSNLPEIEQQILKSVLRVSEFRDVIQTSYTDLFEKRQTIESFIDQNPEWTAARQEEYNRKNELYERLSAEGQTGFENTNIGTLVGFGGDGDAEGGAANAGLETVYTSLQKDLARLSNFLDDSENGAIGKLEKIAQYPLQVPGDVGPSLQNLYLNTKRVLNARMQELGLHNDDDIANLYAPDDRPDFATLARLDMGRVVSNDIKSTAEALIGNDAAQQFQNMCKTQYVALDNIVYAPAQYQSQLTISSLKHRQMIEGALFVRHDRDGAVWYHTETQIIKINTPRFGQDQDQRNMAIWYKSPEERGLDPKFTVPANQPDQVGIFLTANPDNSAAANNTLYGPVQQKINRLLEEAQNDN